MPAFKMDNSEQDRVKIATMKLRILQEWQAARPSLDEVIVVFHEVATKLQKGDVGSRESNISDLDQLTDECARFIETQTGEPKWSASDDIPAGTKPEAKRFIGTSTKEDFKNWNIQAAFGKVFESSLPKSTLLPPELCRVLARLRRCPRSLRYVDMSAVAGALAKIRERKVAAGSSATALGTPESLRLETPQWKWEGEFPVFEYIEPKEVVRHLLAHVLRVVGWICAVFVGLWFVLLVIKLTIPSLSRWGILVVGCGISALGTKDVSELRERVLDRVPGLRAWPNIAAATRVLMTGMFSGLFLLLLKSVFWRGLEGVDIGNSDWHFRLAYICLWMYLCAASGWAAFGCWRHTREDLELFGKKHTVGPLKLREDTPSFHVVHWSDLHIGDSDNAETAEGDVVGNRQFRETVECYAKACGDKDVLLITGDITDTGTEAQWGCFMAEMQKLPEALRRRVVLVPGNHDVNISEHEVGEVTREARDMEGLLPLTWLKNRLYALTATKRWIAESDDGVLRGARRLRMLAAMDELHGERSHVHLADRRVTLRDFLREHAEQCWRYLDEAPRSWIHHHRRDEQSRQWRTDVTPESIRELQKLPSKLWEAVFPLAVDVEIGDLVVVVLVLDSIEPMNNLAENAFGRLGPVQRQKLSTLMQSAERPQIFALHHHLDFDKEQRKDRMKARSQAHKLGAMKQLWREVQPRFMVLVDAVHLIRDANRGRRSVFFHGHRHIDLRTQIGAKVQAISAPSTTLGDELSVERGQRLYYRVGIHWSPEEGCGVTNIEARQVPPANHTRGAAEPTLDSGMAPPA